MTTVPRVIKINCFSFCHLQQKMKMLDSRFFVKTADARLRAYGMTLKLRYKKYVVEVRGFILFLLWNCVKSVLSEMYGPDEYNCETSFFFIYPVNYN